MKVASVEDTEKLQEDLSRIYQWAVENMTFNGDRFQLLRYGKNEKLKRDTEYKTQQDHQNERNTWNI